MYLSKQVKKYFKKYAQKNIRCAPFERSLNKLLLHTNNNMTQKKLLCRCFWLAIDVSVNWKQCFAINFRGSFSLTGCRTSLRPVSLSVMAARPSGSAPPKHWSVSMCSFRITSVNKWSEPMLFSWWSFCLDVYMYLTIKLKP